MRTHSEAIDAFRAASDRLLGGNLNEAQRQDAVDLLNAMQDLNTLYWEQVYANATTGGLTARELKRLTFEASNVSPEMAEAIASHITANAKTAKESSNATAG